MPVVTEPHKENVEEDTHRDGLQHYRAKTCGLKKPDIKDPQEKIINNCFLRYNFLSIYPVCF